MSEINDSERAFKVEYGTPDTGIPWWIWVLLAGGAGIAVLVSQKRKKGK